MSGCRAVALSALFLWAGACQTLTAGDRPGRVTHFVVCWLKTPGDEAARQRLIAESQAFEGKIPGLLAVTAGTALPSPRPTVDSSYDVAVVMTFRDEAALRAYDEHPVHKAAVERTLKPLVERVVIYDFVQR